MPAFGNLVNIGKARFFNGNAVFEEREHQLTAHSVPVHIIINSRYFALRKRFFQNLLRHCNCVFNLRIDFHCG